MSGLIYTRVSTKEQVVDRTSLASQEKECQAFARKAKVDIKEECIFREEGESAKIADRTQLRNLLEYVRKHKNEVDTLYIWKVDRLSRNLGDYYGIKVALNRYGVRIVSVTEPIEDDPVGRFLEAILAAAAQFDNEIRAVRTTGGMRARVQQGEWPHAAPIGYKKQDKHVVADKRFAPIITDILLTFSKGGHNLASISQYAFEKGVTTKSGRPKSTDAMKIILQNMLYAGFTKSKLVEGMNKGRHKALVSMEVIETNIDIITGRKRNYVLQGDDLYPLKNILLCANCGEKLRASKSRGQAGVYYPFYHCPRKTCTKAVTGRRASVSIDNVHEDFRAVLRALKPLDAGIARVFKELVVRQWNDQYARVLETIAILNRQIEEQESMRQKTSEKFIADKITQDEKELQHGVIDSKLATLREELENMNNFKEASEEVIDNAMQFITEPDLFWNHASTSVKQMVQLLLFPNGVPYDFETGFGTYEKLESHLLIQRITPKGDQKSDLVAATGIEPVTLGL
jgi:site-specific DNA recombinase